VVNYRPCNDERSRYASFDIVIEQKLYFISSEGQMTVNPITA
jgi:hypothetical protein